MAHSATAPLRFDTSLGVPLEAAFDAGRLTSDGGLPWVAEANAALGLCEWLAACVADVFNPLAMSQPANLSSQAKTVTAAAAAYTESCS